MKKKMTLMALAVCLSVTKLMATVVYVDGTATGANTGASWADAYTTLSMALQQANPNTSIDSILVARGTYYPTGIQSSTNVDSAFTILRGGLKIYGGYPAGGGIRNLSANPTTLSGNIGNAATSNDNSSHVMVIVGIGSTADSLVVDGFTIQSGYAGHGNNNDPGHDYGGTMVPGYYGGGIYATVPPGYFKGVLRYMTVTDNSTNANPGYGAGMAVSGPLHITDCIVSGNSAGTGGGIYANGITHITNCVISGNSAAGWGGGMSISGSPVVTNCTISGNHSYGDGGGMHINVQSSPVITNCTVSGNHANFDYGGIEIRTFESLPTISNSIIYGNTAQQNQVNVTPGASIVNYSLIEGYTYAAGSAGNLPNTTDPLFLSATDLRLQSISPCINAGSNAAVPPGITTDLDGYSRIQNTTVDMGAYEYGTMEAPVVTFGSDTAFCASDSVVLNAYTPYCTYQWSTGATTPSIVVSTSGTYYVTATNAAGAATDTIQVTVNALPVVNLGNDITLPEGGSTILDAGNPGATYAWTTGASTQTITVNTSGIYGVVVTNAQGCSAADAIRVSMNTVGIDPLSSDKEAITISPNPAKDMLMISISTDKLLHTKTILTDAYGRVMKTVMIESRQQALSLSGLAEGVYLLRMQNGQTFKVVKK